MRQSPIRSAKALKGWLIYPSAPPGAPRCYNTSTFAAGDYVILQNARTQLRDPSAQRLIRLTVDKSTNTRSGPLLHSDLIGKLPRDIVETTNGSLKYRLLVPSLADYVRLTDRHATPIYGEDANTIVSALDIHVTPPTAGAQDLAPPLEMLEAGTGHGSLTLHLARAIHAANPAPPTPPASQSIEDIEDATEDGKIDSGLEDASYEGSSSSDLHDAAMNEGKSSRRAILHTLEIKGSVSKMAAKTVKRFRRGIYAHNVDFHVGTIPVWLEEQYALRKSTLPFLSYVVLDMKDAHRVLPVLEKAMRPDAKLAIFNPSITQIAECDMAIKKQKLGFFQEGVSELIRPRQWDVFQSKTKEVTPESDVEDEISKKSAESVEAEEEGLEDSKVEEITQESAVDVASPDQKEETIQESAVDVASPDKKEESETEKWVTVCRPRFFDRTAGGGFLGLWVRKRDEAIVGIPEK